MTINCIHARWISFIQRFTFIIKHNFGKSNRMVNALSRKTTCLLSLLAEVFGFEDLKDLYAEHEEFSTLWMAMQRRAFIFRIPFLFQGD